MFGRVLRQLIDDGHTSVRAVEQATGRGESTVYRWLSGQTRPDVRDLRAMLRHLEGDAVRRQLLSALLADLPVTVLWHDPPLDARPTMPPADALRDAMDHSVEALRGVSELIAEERDLTAQGSIDFDQCRQLAGRIDEIVHHLGESRLILCLQPGRRRKAV